MFFTSLRGPKPLKCHLRMTLRQNGAIATLAQNGARAGTVVVDVRKADAIHTRWQQAIVEAA